MTRRQILVKALHVRYPDLATASFYATLRRSMHGPCRHTTIECTPACGCPCLTDPEGDVCVCHDPDRCLCDVLDSLPEPFRCTPDGYRISTPNEHSVITIRAYEVEIGHPLDERRLRDYAELWCCLDDTDTHEFELIVVDQAGHEHPVNLAELHEVFLREDTLHAPRS